MEKTTTDLLDIKKEIETRFQVVLTFSIFFPTFVSTFLDNSGMDKKQISNLSLTYTMPVAIFLIDYIIYSILKKSKMQSWAFKSLNILLLVSVASFVVPIGSLATVSTTGYPHSIIEYILFVISLYGLPILSMAVLVLLLSIQTINLIKVIKLAFSKLKKK